MSQVIEDWMEVDEMELDGNEVKGESQLGKGRKVN